MPPKFLIAKQLLNMDLEVLFAESTTDATELILLTNEELGGPNKSKFERHLAGKV